MSESKTIADLPIDVNIRWAESQKLLEGISVSIKDSSMVSQHAQAEVASPFALSYIDVLLGINAKRQPWAFFEKPLGGFQARDVFKPSGLVSFLESNHNQDALIARIREFGKNNSHQENDDEALDQDGLEKEKEIVLGLLALLQNINKDLIEIVSRCKQYQKG